MIVIPDDGRNYSIYCRTSKHIQWRYAEFGGTYESIKECIKKAIKHYGNQWFEYQIEKFGEIVKVGSIDKL